MKNFSTSKPASLFFALLLTSFAFATAVLFHSPSQIHSNTAGPVHSGSPDSIAQGKNNTNAEYQKSMLSGDRYFNEKDYLNAKASYQLAIGQKPGDSIARAKLQKTMELLRSVKAQNILYDVAVASADRLFQAKEYEKARMEYENAGKILPSEQYPKIRINEIIKILVDQQVRDEEYKNAIAEADNFYNLKSFKPALSAYKNANTLKPDEKYPQERIAELTALINEIMAKDEAYNKAIAAADQFFIKIQYPESKKSYQQALTIKPEQAYPKQKIKEIDALLAKALKIQQDYDTYISLADSFYIEKKHREARENYFLASTVKPQENYPREMMNKVDKLMAGAELAARTTEEKYAAAVSAADRLLQDKNYEPARASYVEAGALKPSEGYPKTKIAEIDGILQGIAAQKALENRYLSGIQKGDSLFDGKSYAASRVAYSDALKLKPEEVYPKERITSIDKILAETALQKKLDDQYQQAIESADQLFAAKSYEPAKAGYTHASAIKPQESYPKEKIAEIDRLMVGIAAKKAEDEKYQALLSNADKLLAAKSYEPARAEYANAGALRPEDEYPKTKMEEIDRIMAEMAALRSMEEKYASAVSAADRLLQEKNYDPARASYVEASTLKPTEGYPKTKIAEIDGVLQGIAAQKALENRYLSGIQKGDSLFAVKSYDGARSAYSDALKLKPEEVYPKERITAIDKILAETALQKKLDDQYQQAIESADQLFAAKSYEPAKAGYTHASAIKPQESYPKEKIAEIDRLMVGIAAKKAEDEKYQALLSNADQLLAAKSYEPARAEYANAGALRPEEAYPKTKMEEIDRIMAEMAALRSLEEKYAAAVSAADRLLQEKNYEPARASYVEASALKPTEGYPKTKIAEIDGILQGIAAQKALENRYLSGIQRGDSLFAVKSYDGARSAYSDALKLKPEAVYPKERITAIDKILAETALQKKLDDQYQQAIESADQLFAAKSYEPAKAGYTHASAIKPQESYPKEKIAEIDRLMAGLAAKKAEDEKYQALLANADKLLAAKSYEPARAEYANAGALRPEEAYPKTKMEEIGRIMAEMAALRSLEEKYAAAVTAADRLLQEKNYDPAKKEYGNALALKPAEKYPSGKIAQIDSILTAISNQKALNEEYSTTLANADRLFAQKKYEDARTGYQNALGIKPEESYPKEKLAAITRALEDLLGKQQVYNNFIADGDHSLGLKDYIKAKENFQQAQLLFPDETYPKERLNMITARMDSLYRANKAFYDKAVADGDKFFNLFEFDKAVDAFHQASTFLPMEKYPREMIAKITRTIAENAIADVLNSSVKIAAGDEKQFSFTPVNIASRKNNFIYLKLKNLSDKPFNILMRYGKDKQPNGGVVIRNLSTDGKVNERLVSVRDQDLWYRADNNWISLYPQGGDIEVSFIQVSRAK